MGVGVPVDLVPAQAIPFFQAHFLAEWALTQATGLEELEQSLAGRKTLEQEGVILAVCSIDNYRMALEYVAREVARSSCPGASSERVSFPVAWDAEAFRNMMSFRFPGLRSQRPDLWKLFRSFQRFSPPKDPWLWTLHGLWNNTLPIGVAALAPGSDVRPGSGRGDLGPEGPVERLVISRSEILSEFLERLGPTVDHLIREFASHTLNRN